MKGEYPEFLWKWLVWDGTIITLSYICYRYLALTHEYLMIQHLMGKQIRDPRQRKKLSSSLIEQLYPLILDDRYLSYFPD